MRSWHGKICEQIEVMSECIKHSDCELLGKCNWLKLHEDLDTNWPGTQRWV